MNLVLHTFEKGGGGEGVSRTEPKVLQTSNSCAGDGVVVKKFVLVLYSLVLVRASKVEKCLLTYPHKAHL